MGRFDFKSYQVTCKLEVKRFVLFQIYYNDYNCNNYTSFNIENILVCLRFFSDTFYYIFIIIYAIFNVNKRYYTLILYYTLLLYIFDKIKIKIT